MRNLPQNVVSAVPELVSCAIDVRRHAYVPYSKFAVGAALLGASGRIYVGCNVENLSFGLTLCAERSALATAIGSGEREFTWLAVVSDSLHPVSPCGACRQVLAEFNPGLKVHSQTISGLSYQTTLDVLLPRPADGVLGL